MAMLLIDIEKGKARRSEEREVACCLLLPAGRSASKDNKQCAACHSWRAKQEPLNLLWNKLFILPMTACPFSFHVGTSSTYPITHYQLWVMWELIANHFSRYFNTKEGNGAHGEQSPQSTSTIVEIAATYDFSTLCAEKTRCALDCNIHETAFWFCWRH